MRLRWNFIVSKHILTLRICIVKLQACKTAYKNTGINDTDHMLRLKIYQEKKCCHTQCPYTSHNVFRKGKICVKQNKYGKTGKTRVTLSNSRQTCVKGNKCGKTLWTWTTVGTPVWTWTNCGKKCVNLKNCGKKCDNLNNCGKTCMNLNICGHTVVNLNNYGKTCAKLKNCGKTCVNLNNCGQIWDQLWEDLCETKITVIDICEPEKLWEEMW